MGLGTFIHHVGTLLLLVATVLLIVVDISAPVVNSLALLRIQLGPGTSAPGAELSFGSFGYCQRSLGSPDACSPSRIGYDAAAVVSRLDGTSFSDAAGSTSRVLTRVMVLHPVATILSFLSFLLCLGSGLLGSLLATAVALAAFAVTVVAMVCDFIALSIIKRDVNSAGRSVAHWGPAAWCVLVAAIATLLAAVLVFVTCCSGRSRARRDAYPKDAWRDSSSPGGPRRSRRRHFRSSGRI